MITKRQQDALLTIKDFMEVKGYAPSVRELCDSMGLRSSSTVHAFLKQLKKKGYVDFEKGQSRTLRIVKNE